MGRLETYATKIGSFFGPYRNNNSSLRDLSLSWVVLLIGMKKGQEKSRIVWIYFFWLVQIKVIVHKSRDEVSLVEQDTIDYVSIAYFEQIFKLADRMR